MGQAISFVDQVFQVTEERADNYGSPLINFLRIAIMWSMYLKVTVNPVDVAYLMVLMKEARQMHNDNPDNIIDILGYMKCIDSMHKEMLSMEYDDGYLALESMSVSQMQDLLERILE